MTTLALQRRRLALAGLLATFLALAAIYNAASTPFEAPDEIGHFYYVVHLLQTGRLPVVPAADPPPNYEQEGAQPPLYYASAAALVRLLERPLRLDLGQADARLDVNPHSTCAQPGARYNVAYLAHDPHQERFPYEGRVRVLHVVRLWSSLLGVATVAGVFAAMRLAFPDLPAAAWLAAGITAFTPEFLFTASAASNDNLVTALTTWGVYLALRVLRDGLRWPTTVGLGVLAGLAALSKLSGALLLPFALVVIILALWFQCSRPPHTSPFPHSPFTIRGLRSAICALRSAVSGQRSAVSGQRSAVSGQRSAVSGQRSAICDLRLAIAHSSFLIFSFLSLSGWWFFRNWTLYGDLTGTRPMLELLPLRHEMSAGLLIGELPGLFRSWWGAFGCTAPPGGFYLAYLVLALGGLAGLVADRRRLGGAWPQMGVLVAWLVLVGAAYVRWNWVIHAPKGRLVYPAMVSVAGLLGRGWASWAEHIRLPQSRVPPSRKLPAFGKVRQSAFPVGGLLAVMMVGAGAVPLAVMAPPVAPPPIYATFPKAPSFREGPAFRIPHSAFPLDGRFGAEIALLGYDLEPSFEATSFEAGEWLDLTLYWQALARPVQHYTLAIQLASAVPGETDTLVNFNTWTGGGNFPTGNWRPGDVVVDHYRLRLPGDVPRVQGWYLQAVLFDSSDGTRLPFALGGQPAGKGAQLALLRVGASDPEAQAPPEADRLAVPIAFDGVIALEGVRAVEEGGMLKVTLWWRSVAALAGDRVVFVHLYDAEGLLVATADGPPLAGGFPTSLWRPGDRVRDEHAVPLPAGCLSDPKGLPKRFLSPPLGSAGAGAPLRLGVGWYDPHTGARLAATTADGVRLPDDEFLIEFATPVTDGIIAGTE